MFARKTSCHQGRYSRALASRREQTRTIATASGNLHFARMTQNRTPPKGDEADFEITANLADVVGGEIRPARVTVRGGRVADIAAAPAAACSTFLSPGWVDAHVHIESSMLAPTAFARAAVVHGVVATVSDPHEIANVLGREGVLWMVDNAKRSPFKFHFGAPSCVPATAFETAGAAFGLGDVAALLDTEGIHFLAEVMNFPAVIGGDEHVHAIIAAARGRSLRVDGHAPGVMGDDLAAFAAAGIETDHECVTLDEALARLRLGVRVALREGSAARNFDALWPALREFPAECFLCSDDKHPDDLVRGYLGDILRRAVANGVSPMDALRAATLNPVRHYNLPAGLLAPGDPADMVEFDNLTDFRVRRTWIDGRCVAAEGRTHLPAVPVRPVNVFRARPVDEAGLTLPWRADKPFPVIVARDGQLVTVREDLVPTIRDGTAVSDPDRDLLKIVVVNRYKPAPPAVGLIRNFGLRRGAMAGSVAHDSHNIVAVGAGDTALARAINAVVECGGGLAFAGPGGVETLPLPIAGLMSDGDPWTVAEAFERLTALAQEDGCPMRSPYMTLSFMALLVIPSLKISDRGLFDVDRFTLLG
ncbi:MAG: adenine deaminase [Opitutales bacterium]|nr:adenine deaminase [Opitutales bacterium]